MKKGNSIAMMLAWCIAPVAFAADAPADKTPGAQQMRMKHGTERAGGMKGDERKHCMSDCLEGRASAPG